MNKGATHFAKRDESPYSLSGINSISILPSAIRFVFLLLFLFSMQIFGQTQIVSWSNTNSITNANMPVSSINANLSATTKISYNGLTPSTSNNRWSFKGWDVSSLDKNFVFIELYTNKGSFLNLNASTIAISAGSSTTGPNSFTLYASSDGGNNYNNITTVSSACTGQSGLLNYTLPATGYNGLTSILFKLVGNTTACNGLTTLPIGTSGFDKIAINGYVFQDTKNTNLSSYSFMPQVFPTTGGFDSANKKDGSGWDISWTIGQPIDETFFENGTRLTQGFQQVDAPRIFSFSPTTASSYDTVLINGTALSGTTSVSFGNTSALYFNVLNDTTIQAVVGNGASGNVQVSNPSGTGFLGGFTYNNLPTITTVSPLSGPVGTLVTFTGSNFFDTTSIKIGGVNAIRISNSRTTLVAMVMPNAVTGITSLTNGGHTANGSTFTVVATPFPVTQQGNKLVGTGASIDGQVGQGYSVSISADGNTAIVGGNLDENNIGAAWIYTRTGSVWTQQGNKLKAPSIDETSPGFGTSVGISADGNSAIIGGSNDHSGMGAAWIYTRDMTSKTWSFQSKLVGTGSIGSIVYQGASVGISGDGNTAILGGYYDNYGKGAAWIFNRSGTSWTQTGNKLVGSSSSIDAQLGYSVSMSADGKTASIGGNQDNAGEGAVWIFRNSTNGWSQQTKLADNNSINSNQGSAVALSADGNTVIIGGPFDNNQVGASWIYQYSGGTWVQSAKLIGTNGIGLSQQGYSVALSADGKTATVGGTYDNNGVGAGWVFAKSGVNWVQQASNLKPNGSVGNGYFGSSIALSADGKTGIVGANNDNNGLGAAWLFVGSLLPSIKSFTPDSAVAGAVVTIKGANLSSAKTVSFGGIPAKSFSISVINGDTVILATVSNGASGFVKVTNANGADSAAGFVLLTCTTVYSTTSRTICADAFPYSWNNLVCNSAGTYKVTLKAKSGCDSIATLILTANSLPKPIISNSTTGCAIVTLVASGGKSYLWNGGNSIATATNTFSKTGAYSVTVTDTNNCSASATTIVTVNQLPIAKISGVTSGCDSVRLIASGGNAYLWNGGKYPTSSSNTFTTSGTFTVTVTDTATGCSAIATKTDTVNVRPIASITGTTTACDSVKLTAQGGATNGTYYWNAGNSIQSAVNVFNKSGNYTVTITDANGCVATASKSIVVNSLSSATVTGNDTACSLVTLTANGGTSYTWSGGNNPTAATNTFNLSGRYAVVIKDANGCTAKDSVYVLVNQPPSLSITQGSNGCGKIYLTAVTDSGTLSFNWYGNGSDPISKTNTFTTSGTYTVTVTNTTTSCFSTASKAITIGTLHAISLDNIASTSCLGTSVLLVNGASGASKAFVYKDSSFYYTLLGQTYQKDSTVLVHIDSTTTGTLTTTNYQPNSAASYYAVALFNDGCNAQSSLTNVNVAKIGIIGLSTGCQSVTLTATGGKSYTWNTGTTPSSATNSFNTIGNQTVTVTGTDSNYCVGTSTQNIVVQNLPPPVASIIGNSVGCDSVQLTATGGSTYNWIGGKTPQSASNTFTESGIDSVKVTAANGCAVLLSKSVQINPHPDAYMPGHQSSCGIVTLTAAGGNSYLWNSGNSINSSTNTFTKAGNNIPVSVVVSDSIGCKSVLYDTITVNAVPLIMITGNKISCDSVTLIASGGDSYIWSGGKYSNSAKNVFNQSGTYQVTANNQNGCLATQSVTVSLTPQNPQISIQASDSVLCGSKSVLFTATPILGGTNPLYQWQKGGVAINGATAATYNYIPSNGDIISCVLTSNNNCLTVTTALSNSITIKVTSNVTPTITVSTSASTICSGTIVTFTANTTNAGTVPVYQWKKNGIDVGSNAATYTDPTLNNKDSVWCILKSSANCTTNTNVASNKTVMTVTASVIPSIVIAATNTNICAGTSVTLSAIATNGGASPTYQWKKNGIVVGSNSATYTDANLNNNDSVWCVLRSNATCAINNAYASNTIVERVNNYPAVFGNALSFDGVDDYVVLPNNAAYNASKITMETWVYWSATDNAAVQFLTSKSYELLEIHTGGGAGANGLRFIPTPGVYLDVPNVLPLNTWTHVAFVYDPSSANAKVYINGINTTYTITAGSVSTPITSLSNNVFVGKRIDGNYPFNGKLDELRIWNTALTQAQIQAHMNIELAGNETGLISYYNFNQGLAASNNPSAIKLIDYSNTNNSGTLNNFSLNGNTSNFVTGISNSLSPISGASTLCSGISTQFSNNMTGGVWSSLNSSYATVNSLGMVTGQATGTSTIAYSLTSGAGCNATVNKTISINTSVTPSVSILATSGGSVCLGTTITFTATASNGGTNTTYQWTKNSVSISGATLNIYNSSTLTNNDTIRCVITSNATCATIPTAISNAVVVKIKAASSSTTNQSICSTALPFIWNGTSYNATGTYIKTLVNAAGCDSVATLNLIVKSVTTSTTNASICAGASYTFNGTTFTKAGSYVAHLTNSVGCDSAATLNLTVKATSSSITNATINQGATYAFNGTNYTTAGSFIAYLKNSVGCDSIATLNLTVISNYTINGNIKNPLGTIIPSVSVAVNGTQTAITDANGNYSCTVLANSNSIIMPSKNNDKTIANGINGTDISLIQSHILKKVLLNSPYKLIAGDVNSDGAVNGTDIALIKSLILKRITKFSGNRLWAFVDSSYKFPIPTKPFPFYDSISIPTIIANQTAKNFIGVKLGDVNYDWNAAVLGANTSITPIQLYYDHVSANNTSTEIRVPIRDRNFRNIMGMQYTLNFNSNAMELKAIEKNQLGADYNLDFAAEGKLPFLWVDAANEAKSIADSTVIFELVFIKKNNFTKEDIQLSSDITDISAFDANYTKVGVVKSGGIISDNSTSTINMTVYPNPAKETLTIKGVHIVQVDIIDNLGKVIKSLSLHDATNPTIQVGGIGAGIYHLRVQSTSGIVNGLNFIKE